MLAADSDTDGVSIAANALSLNGGTINDDSGLAADLDHSEVAASASHKVDGSVSGTNPVASISAPAAVKSGATGITLDGSGSSDPNPGQTATLTYAWTQTAPVSPNAGSGLTLSSATAASPTFDAPTIADGGSDITLTFELEVTDTDGNTGSATASIIATHEATVSGVTIGGDDLGVTRANTYVQGEDIDVAVQFSENVTVDTTGGTPQLALVIGSATRNANYASGTSTNTLTFTYTVPSGDSDDNGISIAANALSLNGGTINDAAGLPAALGLGSNAVTNNASYKVDGSVSAGAPTANAGTGRLVAAGTARVDLTGSATDPNDGQTLTYAWTQTQPTTGAGAGVTMTNANMAQASFAAPNIANASDPDITLVFRLTVTDDGSPTPLGYGRCDLHSHQRGRRERRHHWRRCGRQRGRHLCGGAKASRWRCSSAKM